MKTKPILSDNPYGQPTTISQATAWDQGAEAYRTYVKAILKKADKDAEKILSCKELSDWQGVLLYVKEKLN